MSIQTYMLDTNIFNKFVDDQISIGNLPRHRLVVTGIQTDELNATGKAERRASLLAVFKEVDAVPLLASTFCFGIEGAGFGQATWNDGTGRFQEMLGKLKEIDHQNKKRKKPENQTRDSLIAETALKNDAILVSDDVGLRQLISEFGGRAISLEEFLAQ